MANEIPNINYELNVANTVPAPVDDTLSIPGEAADAAAVGAALAASHPTLLSPLLPHNCGDEVGEDGLG